MKKTKSKKSDGALLKNKKIYSKRHASRLLDLVLISLISNLSR